MVLDLNAIARSEEISPSDNARYNVPSSRPCTATPTEHIYNNQWLAQYEGATTQGSENPCLTQEHAVRDKWLSGMNESNSLRDQFLEQNHHYVNGYALRESLRQACTQSNTDSDATMSGGVVPYQHNPSYVQSTPGNAIVNRCYDFDFALPKLIQARKLCDIQVNENYL